MGFSEGDHCVPSPQSTKSDLIRSESIDSISGVLKATTPAFPRDVTLDETFSLTAAADIVSTWQIWDPTLNNNAGDFKNTGALRTLGAAAGAGQKNSPTTIYVPGSTGSRIRVKMEIKRAGAAVKTEYSNEILCP